MRVENIRSYTKQPGERTQYIDGTREEVIKKFEKTLDESLIAKLDEPNPDVLLCFAVHAHVMGMCMFAG